MKRELFINHSPLGGKGVFASGSISTGEIIELCPVLVLDESDLQTIHQTKLHDYYFLWGESGQQCAIALGYGSLYNHQYQPNAEYHMDFEFETITIVAINDISLGEEITINYNGEAMGREKLWFDPS